MAFFDDSLPPNMQSGPPTPATAGKPNVLGFLQFALGAAQQKKENAWRQQEVSSIMAERQAREAAARQKYQQQAEIEAQRQQGLALHRAGMDAWDAEHPAPEWKEGNEDVVKKWNAARDAKWQSSMGKYGEMIFPQAKPADLEKLHPRTPEFIPGPNGAGAWNVPGSPTVRPVPGTEGNESRERIAEINAASRERIAAGKDTRTTAEKNIAAMIKAHRASERAGGFPDAPPGEDEAWTAEELGKGLSGAGKSAQTETAKRKDIEYLQTIKDPEIAEMFRNMIIGKSGQPGNEAEALRKFAAQQKMRAVPVTDKDYNVQIDAIVEEYKRGGKAAGGTPAQKFDFGTFEAWKSKRESK